MSRVIAPLNRWSQAMGIRTKIMGLAVGMVILMGVTASVLAQKGFMDSTSAELERRGLSIASDVAARGVDMLLTHNLLGMHELLRGTLQNNEDVRYVIMYDAKGRVAAHTFGTAFPRDLLTPPRPVDGERSAVQLLSTEEGLLHDMTLSILAGSAGYVRVGMSPERLRREAISLTEWLIAVILAVASLALVSAYVMTNFLTRPVLALADVARAAAAGDLTRRAPPGPPDEIGFSIATFNEMLDRLQESQQLNRQLMNRVFSAQEDERRRIARELHDETSQAITSLIVGLRALEEEHPDFRHRSEELRHLASATLEEIHNLILELRPRVLDELGLVPALRRYTADFGHKHSIAVEFQSLGSVGRLPPMVETCVYRVVQEALTNVARHAEAQSASVVLDIRPELVTAIIEDDGKGFDLDQEVSVRSLGLAGMRERASLLDGSLQIESSPGSGTAIFLKIPLIRSGKRGAANLSGR